MKNFYDFTPVEEALAPAQTFAVVLPTNLNTDKVAAALALFLSLKKAGKQVSIACSSPMIVEYSSLIGVDKIGQKFGGRNLMVSFDYHEDSIEKVSYHIENNKFNLVIQPKEGYPPLSTQKINYSYFGNQADVVLTVGAASWENLGNLYHENKKLFEESQSINLDISSHNSQFAKVNLVESPMASLSELVTLMLSSLNLPLDEDIASNLLLGIKKASFDFSLNKSGPSTFEAVAICLRAGARQPFHETRPERKPDFKKSQKPVEVAPQKPSPDWYKPKIYKGDTRV